jgi:hypothetical protein
VAIGISLWRHDWVPTGDDAIIAWRSYDVFTPHAPLVGQFSLASIGATVYDPGPLEYWALAVPVRLLPIDIGPVVGATAVEIASVVVALVAVARRFGRLSAVIVTAGGLVGVVSAAAAVTDPVWNPDAALLPFAALLLVGWVVASGSIRWWVVVVLLASYCIQAHLMYAPTAVLVAVTAPVVGLLMRTPRTFVRRDAGWMGIGLVAGLLAWSAPIYQELTVHPGNLTLIWRSTVGTHQSTVGWWYALDRLARGIGPHPSWLGLPQPQPGGFAFLATDGGQVWTLAAAALLVVLAVIGIRRGRREVSALCLIALVAMVGGAWAIAGITNLRLLSLAYISWLTWPIGMLVWFAVGWGALRLFGGPLLAGLRTLAEERRPLVPAALVGLCCLSLGAGIATALTVARWPQGDQYSSVSNGAAAVDITRLVVAEGIPRGRLHVAVSGDPALVLVPAVAYQLAQAGWEPTVSVLKLHFTKNVLALPTDPVLSIAMLPANVAPGAEPLGVVTVRDPDGTPQRWYVGYVKGT